MHALPKTRFYRRTPRSQSRGAAQKARGFARPRDRGQTNLHADLVVVLSERPLLPQVTHDELRVPLALEIRQPHVVDAPVLDLGRLDFGRITRIAQRLAHLQRVAERLA